MLETMEIAFEADLSAAEEQLKTLEKELNALAAQSGKADKALSGIAEGLKGALKGFDGRAEGLRAVRLLADGLTGGEGAVRSASARLGRAVQGIDSSALRPIGRQLAAGFAAGISDGSSLADAAVRRLVSRVTEKMRSLLQIHSPSRLTHQMGAYFGEGFAEGIEDRTERAAQAARDMSLSSVSALTAPERVPETAARDTVDEAVRRVLGGVNLTIPIEVDGIRLGEASIRGINAVTRAAGRLLLDR